MIFVIYQSMPGTGEAPRFPVLVTRTGHDNKYNKNIVPCGRILASVLGGGPLAGLSLSFFT